MCCAVPLHLPASREIQTWLINSCIFIFWKKKSEFVDSRLGVPSNELNIGSKIHSIFIMLKVCTQKSISYKDLQRLHWLHHLILNASRNIRGKGLYIFFQYPLNWLKIFKGDYLWQSLQYQLKRLKDNQNNGIDLSN